MVVCCGLNHGSQFNICHMFCFNVSAATIHVCKSGSVNKFVSKHKHKRMTLKANVTDENSTATAADNGPFAGQGHVTRSDHVNHENSW